MSARLTDEQREAVAARGETLVSASAGSGKTFVMIERLVSLILAGTDVKNVLCVTFTNKAAAQMRERLRAALLKRIGETEGETRARLKAQLSELALADISTIHAFCGRLVRTRFYLAGVDPAFRIVSPDDAEAKALSARAMDEAFEEAYEQDGGFYELLGVWFRKKRDKRLRALVTGLYANVRASSEDTLGLIGQRDLFEEACDFLYRDFRARALAISDRAEELGAFCAEHSARALQVCSDVMAACAALLEAQDLFGMTELSARPPAIAVMPRMTGAEGEALRALRRLSALSKAVKALFGELGEYALRSVERLRYEDADRRAAALAALTLKYGALYARYKAERAVLDYDDLERYALKILENGDARKELSAQYRYVFVDEYQDVNPIQEKLISCLSGGDVFLVGDSKQAIYGFRGSRSEYFENKERAFRTLRLSANFRSAPAILEAVNRVFSPLIEGYVPMSGGARYAERRGEVCFHLLAEEKKGKPERGVYSVRGGGERERTDALADEVVRLVEEELGSIWYDADEGREKRVGYGDIAVLVRKNTGDAERIARACASRGIPVSSSAETNVFDYFEARLIVDWLSLLDNAEQDVPLGTALLSPVGGFTNGELARIRLRFPSPYTFRAACAEYRAKMRDPVSEKLEAFYGKLERLRARAKVLTAAQIAGELLSAGLEAQIASKGNGKARLLRVSALLAAAEGDGVHAFLDRLKATEYRLPFSESGGTDAVKVHTMHASKGLEYPVVILAGLDAPFHGTDRDEVMWSDRFLAAPKSYDLGAKTVCETVLRRAQKRLQERRELTEERNLLYVSMTRARYRLHMIFAGKEPAFSPEFANRFSDFIDLSRTADYFTEPKSAEAPAPRRTFVYRPDEALMRQISEIYCRPYPFAASTELPVKSSATDLMRAAYAARSVSFGEGEDNLQDAFSIETGLAYHAFLQNVRFGADADGELRRMRAEHVLTEEQALLLEKEQLARILEIPCLKSLEGKRVYREQTFLTELTAREVGLADTDDRIVFQGAIDLLAEDGDGFTVIDYKFSSHDDGRLRSDYAIQIALYRKAVARCFGVDERTVRARIVNIARCREIPM